MPVTRSTSRSHSQQRSDPPYPSRRTASGTEDTKESSKPSDEIIVLSSDDDEPHPKVSESPKKSTHRSLKKKTATPAAPPAPVDVLEISSDDENQPKKPSSKKRTLPSDPAAKHFQRTITILRKELKQTEKRLVSTSQELKQTETRLASTSREVEELKRDCGNKSDFSGLEEHTACEVCTLTMWRPYILPECGHSFCQDCLINWFSKTQAQHLAANPHLEDSRAGLVGQLHAFVQLVPNLRAYGPHGEHHVRAVIAELRRHRPEYSCPSCRKEVISKPIEDFRFKGLIKEIAGMLGEKDPCKGVPRSRTGSGPFDHFFAAPISTR